MNGFGQDPFRIYSSQLPSSVPQIARTEFPKRSMAGLRSSLGYKQTDMEGRQRMETLVGMGLPSTTDISQVRLEGIGIGGAPRYSAPRPLPFGSYGGGFGPMEEPPVPTPTASSTGVTQAPSLTQATELRETMVGQTGQPMAFTGFGQMAREQKADQYQTPVGRGVSAMPSTSPTLAAAGVPRFPFAGAESAFERGARTATAGTNVRMPTAAFGDMPLLPSSRFGGPQPAETMGPVTTPPRRPWMY